MMRTVAVALILLPFAVGVYAYFIYPLLLRLVPRAAERGGSPGISGWPMLTVVIPCYNEERSIAATLDGVLGADYPADRREVLVVSDASTDRTDQIVASYQHRGVRLIRLDARSGKTAAENAARQAARGDVIINTDASVRVDAGALKALVTAFADPTVGVASGEDVSVGDYATDSTHGESRYVDYEMRVRALETRAGTIIGASGCLFATRKGVDDLDFPLHLSRDFASALIAREHGYRSVSVPEAICFVPRSGDLEREMSRKARTMHRGLATLWYKRSLMNPFKHGRFAFMLISHKLCRWLVYASLPFSALGLVLLAIEWKPGRVLLALAALGAALGLLGIRSAKWRRRPPLLPLAGYATASVLAGLRAWLDFFRGVRSPTWNPTKRVG